ncbi:MAG: DNA recombination protein RmuC [candidate division Zixibacteria bacterium]|nr:DNA recombination protein RmuC [candidate division Zixibacteria bacterium]
MNIIIAIIITAGILTTFFIWIFKSFSRKIENNILSKIEDSFGRAAFDALSKNSDLFLNMAGDKFTGQSEANLRELAVKKELIDNTLLQMKTELEKVQNIIGSFENDRNEKFGALSNGLSAQLAQTEKLKEIANKLNATLSDTRLRGIWGQRIADDILRLIGLEEGINYIQQKTMNGSAKRPDFTFMLPDGKVINMDVKFPLNNFRLYIEENNEAIRQNYKNQFLKDARTMIKQVITREYINPDSNTLDCVIVFIPLEQAYSFIMENDTSFMDDALKNKVIVCSPWTLYALLSVIRHSIDIFNLEQSAHKRIEAINNFYKQWDGYLKAMEKVGKKIEELQSEYAALITTRQNQLEKSLQQIAQLSTQPVIPSDTAPETERGPEDNNP